MTRLLAIVIALGACTYVTESAGEHGVCGVDAAVDVAPDVAVDASPDDAPRQCLAVILTGDSNARGMGKVSELTGADLALADPYPAVDEYARLANGTANPPAWTTYDWSPLQPRVYAGVNTFGFELTLMRDLATSRPAYRWVLIKETIGGTTLYDSWNPNTTAPWIFANVHDDVQAQLTASGCTAALYVHVLGGNDALQTSRAHAYGTRYPLFVDAVRLRWPNIPIVFGRLHDSTAYPFDDVVQAGQDALLTSRPNVYEVDQSGLVLRSDGFHYTTSSVIQGGHLYAADAPEM